MPQEVEGDVARDAVEDRVDAGPRGELGRQVGEQRGVTEDLAARDDRHDGLFVDELERAVVDDVELGARHAALDQHGLAGGGEALDHRARHALELELAQAGEGLDAGQEPAALPDLLLAGLGGRRRTSSAGTHDVAQSI